MFAEVLRVIHGVRFAGPRGPGEVVADRVTTMALDRAVMLTPPEIGRRSPKSLRRADGTSKFRARGSEVYSTQELLDAEDRLLQAAAAVDGPTALAHPWPTSKRRPSMVEEAVEVDVRAVGCRERAVSVRCLSPNSRPRVAAVVTSGRRG